MSNPMEENRITLKNALNIEHRRWGFQHQVIAEDGHLIKKLHIRPYSKTSTHKHTHRKEWWHILFGNATLLVGNKTYQLRAGESFFVPKNTWHQIRNENSLWLVMMEMQMGETLSEGDIVRR